MNFIELAEKFQVSEDEFKDIISSVFSNNIHALAFFEGYNSEYVLEKKVHAVPGVTDVFKPGDNNLQVKGDLVATYKNVPLSIEVKNVRRKYNDPSRRPRVVQNLLETYWVGTFCTRSSRSRKIKFSDGSEAQTYNVLRGRYDIIAVNVFQMTKKQEFVYCLEKNLPSTKHGNTHLTPLQCDETLQSEIHVRWPPVEPWTDDLGSILEQAYQSSKQQ